MKENIIIGSHVKMSKQNKYLLGALEETKSYNANTFMIYTGAPQNTKRVPTDNFFIEEFHNNIKKYNIDVDNLIIHAPYIINLGNTIKRSTYELGVEFLIKEIKRAEEIGIKIIVLHPGAAVGAKSINALNQIIKGLNKILTYSKNTKIALETMAGKGTEVGINFQQLKYIIDNINEEHQNKIGVCWDTCHMHDAGYDLENNLENIITDFEEKIGLNKLFVFHINDSKNPINSHKDRHQNIGYGYIKFDTLNKIVHHKKFKNIPKILETPYVNGAPYYKEEIENFVNKKFKDFL